MYTSQLPHHAVLTQPHAPPNHHAKSLYAPCSCKPKDPPPQHTTCAHHDCAAIGSRMSNRPKLFGRTISHQLRLVIKMSHAVPPALPWMPWTAQRTGHSVPAWGWSAASAPGASAQQGAQCRRRPQDCLQGASRHVGWVAPTPFDLFCVYSPYKALRVAG